MFRSPLLASFIVLALVVPRAGFGQIGGTAAGGGGAAAGGGVGGNQNAGGIKIDAEGVVSLVATPVKGLKSHLAMTGVTGTTMQRRWFVPSYQAISRDEGGLAFQFAGPRAKLLTEEEVVDANGNRSSATTINKSAQAFAKLFSEKFPQLADKSPIFGELQNLIDWSVLAALLTKERIPERIGWKQELLRDERRLTYPVFDVPKKVPSQVNYKRAGHLVIGLVSGGVIVHPQQAYDQSVSLARDSSLNETRSKVSTLPRAEIPRWWWDASR